MRKRYKLSLKLQVLDYLKLHSVKETSRVFDVSLPTLYLWNKDIKREINVPILRNILKEINLSGEIKKN